MQPRAAGFGLRVLRLTPHGVRFTCKTTHLRSEYVLHLIMVAKEDTQLLLHSAVAFFGEIDYPLTCCNSQLTLWIGELQNPLTWIG